MCKSSRSFNKALTREASITIINPSSNAMLEEVDLEGGKTTAPVLPPIHIPLLSSWGEIVRRLLFVACIIAGVAYVVLRWYSAITSKAWLGLPIVISETLCVLWGLMEMYVTWRPVKRAGRDLRVVMPDSHQWPTVDVFIPCYTEPVSVVKGTTQAALRLIYPSHKLHVYVLDDGKNPGKCQSVAMMGPVRFV